MHTHTCFKTSITYSMLSLDMRSSQPRHGQAKPGALPALTLVVVVVAAAGRRFGPRVQATLPRTKGGPGLEPDGEIIFQKY